MITRSSARHATPIAAVLPAAAAAAAIAAVSSLSGPWWVSCCVLILIHRWFLADPCSADALRGLGPTTTTADCSPPPLPALASPVDGCDAILPIRGPPAPAPSAKIGPAVASAAPVGCRRHGATALTIDAPIPMMAAMTTAGAGTGAATARHRSSRPLTHRIALLMAVVVGAALLLLPPSMHAATSATPAAPEAAPPDDPTHPRHARVRPNDYERYTYLAIQIDVPNAHARDLDDGILSDAMGAARTLGGELVGPVGALADHFLVAVPRHHAAAYVPVFGGADLHSLISPAAPSTPAASTAPQPPASTPAATRPGVSHRHEHAYHRHLERRAAAMPAVRWSKVQIPQRRLFRRPWVTSPSSSSGSCGASADAASDADVTLVAGVDGTTTSTLARRRLVPRRSAADDKDKTSKDEINQAIEAVRAEFGITDPLFSKQWHLMNPLQPGNDMNVVGAWRFGYTGRNVTISFIDDGINYHHKDLEDAFYMGGSYDFNDHVPLPMPRLPEDRHGTRCAGEVAGRRGNDVCGAGIAWDARVSGSRILSGDLTEVEEAGSLTLDLQNNHIFSCSWGPADNGKAMEGPPDIVLQAFLTGITKGRGGKGSIYVFASGNGGSFGDNCNFDGYTNSIYSITIGAVDRHNQHPVYSEACSAVSAVAYSSMSPATNSEPSGISTTDWPAECTESHGGTSAAAPLVSGILALALEARPDLTWRDAQHLVIQTAEPIAFDPATAQPPGIMSDGVHWQPVAENRYYHHGFGFGRVNAEHLIQKALNWTLVAPQTHVDLTWSAPVDAADPSQTGILFARGAYPGSPTSRTATHVFNLTPEQRGAAGLGTIEHVTLVFKATYPRRGEVRVRLTDPLGRVSVLSPGRRNDVDSAGFVDWMFMSVVHWGLTGTQATLGKWTLVVDADAVNAIPDAANTTGRFLGATLTLYGASDLSAPPVPPHLPPGHDGAPAPGPPDTGQPPDSDGPGVVPQLPIEDGQPVVRESHLGSLLLMLLLVLLCSATLALCAIRCCGPRSPTPPNPSAAAWPVRGLAALVWAAGCVGFLPVRVVWRPAWPFLIVTWDAGFAPANTPYRGTLIYAKSRLLRRLAAIRDGRAGVQRAFDGVLRPFFGGRRDRAHHGTTAGGPYGEYDNDLDDGLSNAGIDAEYDELDGSSKAFVPLKTLHGLHPHAPASDDDDDDDDDDDGDDEHRSRPQHGGNGSPKGGSDEDGDEDGDDLFATTNDPGVDSHSPSDVDLLEDLPAMPATPGARSVGLGGPRAALGPSGLRSETRAASPGDHERDAAFESLSLVTPPHPQPSPASAAAAGGLLPPPAAGRKINGGEAPP